MDGPWGHYSKWGKLEKDNIVWSHLYLESKKNRTCRNSRLVVVVAGVGMSEGDQRTQTSRTSLVAQWLTIHLSVQGTRVQALVREDLTCHGATKPVCHNYWACMPQLLSPHTTTTEALVPRARAPQQEKPPWWEAHAPQWRVAPARRN